MNSSDTTLTLIISFEIISLIFIYYLIKKNSVKKLSFNTEIITAYETWLNQNVYTYMTRYVEETTGKELITEDNLDISSKFAIDGIAYVCGLVITNMPDFYLDYMIDFYGEDKLYTAIHEKIRLIFIKYVENERMRRLKQKKN